MADQKWNKGDVVQLKSGGVRMTVESIDEEYDLITCTWFGDKNKLERADFSAVTLTSGSFRGMA
jgi:uncharacterized protein YodC (DUF2158 family)